MYLVFLFILNPPSRFIINVPSEELASFERILFLIEQAHWFYMDHYYTEDKRLPKYTMKEFTTLNILFHDVDVARTCVPIIVMFLNSFLVFESCPFLKPYIHDVDRILLDFMAYKFRVPVCGAILMNETLDKVKEKSIIYESKLYSCD
jgi:mRNA-decapping enzyme subunit 2